MNMSICRRQLKISWIATMTKDEVLRMDKVQGLIVAVQGGNNSESCVKQNIAHYSR